MPPSRPDGGGPAAAEGVDEDDEDLKQSLVQGPRGVGPDGSRAGRGAWRGICSPAKLFGGLALGLAAVTLGACAVVASSGHAARAASLERKWDRGAGRHVDPSDVLAALRDVSLPQPHSFVAKHGWMRRGRVLEALKKVDLDGDGVLDSKELALLDEALQAQLHISSAVFYSTLDDCDSDGDGKLGKREVPALLEGLGKQAALSRRFDQLDVDQNGKMEGAELDNLAEQLREHAGLSPDDFQRAFEEADVDGDGGLRRDEASAFVRAMMRHEATFNKKFRKLDLDGSGDLDGAELRALAEKLRRRFGLSEAAFQDALQVADSNGNSRLERSEMEALLQSARDAALAPWRFHELDLNGDGEVQGEELQELSSRIQAELGLWPEAAKEVLDGADADGDGALQSSEGPDFLRLLWKRKLSKEGPRDGDGASE